METTNAALRTLYTDCRNAKRDGLPIDRSAVVSMVRGADAKIVAAFDALLGGSIAADAAQQVADARRMEDTFRANMAARAKAQRAAAERNARADGRRLARESSATITEF
jgi:hypothetical protein